MSEPDQKPDMNEQLQTGFQKAATARKDLAASGSYSTLEGAGWRIPTTPLVAPENGTGRVGHGITLSDTDLERLSALVPESERPNPKDDITKAIEAANKLPEADRVAVLNVLSRIETTELNRAEPSLLDMERQAAALSGYSVAQPGNQNPQIQETGSDDQFATRGNRPVNPEAPQSPATNPTPEPASLLDMEREAGNLAENQVEAATLEPGQDTQTHLVFDFPQTPPVNHNPSPTRPTGDGFLGWRKNSFLRNRFMTREGKRAWENNNAPINTNLPPGTVI